VVGEAGLEGEGGGEADYAGAVEGGCWRLRRDGMAGTGLAYPMITMVGLGGASMVMARVLVARRGMRCDAMRLEHVQMAGQPLLRDGMCT